MDRSKVCGYWQIYIDGILADNMGAVDDETEKAILLSVVSDDFGCASGWFPKSQIAMIEKHDGREIRIPQWLFDKKRDV